MDIQDYDPGLLNDYDGGNVDWWFDYIRYEVNRCNEYWRSRLEEIEREPEDSADICLCDEQGCNCSYIGTMKGYCMFKHNG